MIKPLINLQMLQHSLTLSPSETIRINFTGSYVSILTNTGTVDPVIAADSGTATALRAGLGLPSVSLSTDQTTLIPAVFRYVEFTNPSATETITIEFLLSLGTPLDTRTVVSGYLQVDLSAPELATIDALTVSTSAVSVLAANALVKERIVQNTGDNPIWWGDADIDPANSRGIRLYPDESAVINCWGAVYFMAETGASKLSVVNVMKEI